MQPDFLMVGDSASSLLQLTDPFPTSTTPGTSAATAASTSAATAASTSAATAASASAATAASTSAATAASASAATAASTSAATAASTSAATAASASAASASAATAASTSAATAASASAATAASTSAATAASASAATAASTSAATAASASAATAASTSAATAASTSAATAASTSAATAASTSAATAASATTLPSHEDVIRGNVDANLWGLDDIDLSNTFFEDLDMNFNFASPSTFIALLPAASSATSLPDMLFPSPLTTSFAAPVSAMSFATSLPAMSSAAASSPAALSAAPISSINPAVFSLNNAEGYRPPRPPPLVPSHAEFQRTSCATTPTPDNSSEETDPKFWFSTDPTTSTSSGLSASKSSHKCARTVASDCFNTQDMSTSIVTTMKAIREQQTVEHRVDHHEKKVAQVEQLADKKEQCDHEWNMLQQRREHDLVMLAHQKGLADTELRKMEVELEILKHQE
ncbi:hypothetical protein L210DRAFT_3649488 [Boletus edulis BED1]|uniref:Uncharacterized protein n=1 Tax=Boletus edulis BED1 TaxID=1328754 RepID=A0AAD4GAX1_BOLED|nr:hypothetical protein L210DRAFT_3649488 [Boletus edulis BED1]